MTEPTGAALFGPEWLTNTLRVTLFATEVEEKFPETWWHAVAGTGPESVNRPKMGGFQASGEFGTGRSLVLEIAANRISWNLIAPLSAENVGVEFPNFGPFIKARDEFLEAIETWLPSAPPVYRVAFGSVLILPRASKEEAYAALSFLLPFQLNPKNEGDFVYTINRYATSQSVTPALRINRLRKWTAARLQIRASTADWQPVGVLSETGAVVLELDINTDADRRDSLPAERLAVLIRELAELGTTIAERGDLA